MTTGVTSLIVYDDVVPACAAWSAVLKTGEQLQITDLEEIDTLVLVSNCPQINNPCNGFNPTPVRMVISAR
jgi:uncharacterized protein YcgI (DUF1989 family)